MPTTTPRTDHAVFVDRYGRRRSAMIGTGVFIGIALIAWLVIMCIGFEVVVGHNGPSDVDTSQ